jgi:hypothetical protein
MPTLQKTGKFNFTCICGHGVAGQYGNDTAQCGNPGCGEVYWVSFAFGQHVAGTISAKLRANEEEAAGHAGRVPDPSEWIQGYLPAATPPVALDDDMPASVENAGGPWSNPSQ